MTQESILYFFDTNCVLGRRVTKEKWERNFSNAEDLERELDYYNIKEALVYHFISKEYDPYMGNNILLKEIEGHSRLHGMWVLNPDIIWEEQRLDEFINQMIKLGVKTVRLFPKTHGYYLNRRTCGPLIEELRRLNVPIFIDLAETSWKEIDEFLTQYPDIPLVVTQLSSWGDDRYFYPLLRDFRNLYLEFSFYRIMGGLKAIKDRFGVDQLVFGSGLPFYAAGGPINEIMYSELSFQEKQKIAYFNIKNLIEGVKNV